MEAEESRVMTLMKQFLTELSDYRVSPSSDDYHTRSSVVENYFVSPEDVEGEVVNWSLQYLEQRKCPSILTLAISKHIAEQLKECVEKENKFSESVQNTGSGIFMDAVHLHSETIRHLHDLCDHWREHPDQLMKHIADIKENPYFTSVCTIKNIRRKMEDRYTIIHNLNVVCGLKDAPHHSYYGVFDGHAGTRAANYAAAHLHSNIAHHPSFLTDPVVAIKEGFKMTDTQILERSKKENTKSGCTVVCSFLNEKALHVAWVGDSQAILVRHGVPYIITNPHKPDRQDERQRIEDLNGCVLFIGTWRVNGTLAVSRALGDPEHKPYVCAEPDVVTIPLESNEDFFVLACDGLWDRLNPSDVASAIYSHIVEHSPNDYDEVASRLVLQAKEHGSGDNITAIVVFLKDPKELAANPKNPPPYSLQLNGSKVDSWCQGSWNGTHENDNNSMQYIYPEALTERAVKPNSLGDLPNQDGAGDVCQIRNFQFNPVTCEAGRSCENDESKNLCHSSMNSIMPETTAFSELPTPPIDELLASQQFGEQDKLVETTDTLSIVSETTEIKSSCVTLVDSGILDQDYIQVKQSCFPSQDTHVIPVSSNNHKDDILSADTAVEMASEIVNNAIDLAVNQVMVRTSSQMSQHFDDSGLEEGPLEESDVSPVSASPEFDGKPTNRLQELLSFNNEESSFLQSENNIKLEVSHNHSEQHCQIQHDESELSQFSKGAELDYVHIPNTCLVELSEKDNESHQNLNSFNHCSVDEKVQYSVSEDSTHLTDEVHPQAHTGNLLDSDIMENVIINTSCLQVTKPFISTPHQNREKTAEVEYAAVTPERLKDMLKDFDTVTCSDAENLFPVANSSLLQPASKNTTACISSSAFLHSDVGQLFEHLSGEENKTLSTALSNSLSEELQSGVTPIDLVTIPDEVPEAEGVTEDSDSEKDGGWSYIQGSKTDLPKQKPGPSVSKTVGIKSSTSTNKKPPNKPERKETVKPVTETKILQLKSNTKKKILSEKADNKDKISSRTLKITKLSKTTPVVEKKQKPSSASSKAPSQGARSVETTLRPKSSVISSSRLPASKTVAANTQKTALVNLAMPKQQKSAEQKITSTTHITTTTASTTRTITRMQKPAPRPQIPTVQKAPGKATTSQVVHTGTVTQPRARTQLVKSASITHAPKSNQDIKQTKESTNKQILSQPPLLPRKKEPVLPRTAVIQNSLPSRIASKPTTSKQSTGPPKPSLAKSQKPFTKPSVKNKVSIASGAKSTISKTTKDMQKATEKPDDLKQQSSEQEKGTKEELTKEIVTEIDHVDEECVLKQESLNSYSVETELENEAIQKLN